MRYLAVPLLTTTLALLAISPAHAASTPTKEQIQTAIDTAMEAAMAKSSSGVPPMPARITSLVSCRPSQEKPEEVACLVGMSAGMRDGYTVLPLRLDGANWVGVERKGAQFPAPTPAEAQAAMRAAAEQMVAANPDMAKDKEVQITRTTLQVKTIKDCEVERKSGHFQCSTTLSIPEQKDINTELKFAVDGAGWKFLPRK
ncbi:MAG: hypothetical protein ABW202_01095 [Duganella sp.]